MTKETIPIHIYNFPEEDHGHFPGHSDILAEIDKEWAEKFIRVYWGQSLDEFFSEYTFDDSEELFNTALNAGTVMKMPNTLRNNVFYTDKVSSNLKGLTGFKNEPHLMKSSDFTVADYQKLLEWFDIKDAEYLETRTEIGVDCTYFLTTHLSGTVVVQDCLRFVKGNNEVKVEVGFNVDVNLIDLDKNHFVTTTIYSYDAVKRIVLYNALD